MTHLVTTRFNRMNLNPVFFKTHIKLGLTLLCLCFSAFPLAVAAQDAGSVSGIVRDAETHDPLPSVNVIVEGLDRGTASEIDGAFYIGNLPPGAYELTFSFIGFASQHAHVVVRAGETISIEVELSPDPFNLEGITLVADRPYSAASSRTVRGLDLQVRPVRSSQDLLQLAPGLITAQHGGGGKAEQIFLRGFDADHGTDINISVDGVPVNMVSHGHGQGYADLHFIIPEVVDRIDVFEGPYATRFGNLATAGAIAFSTRNHLPYNLVRASGGSFGTARLTGMYQIPMEHSHQGAYLAGEFYRTDGPVDDPQDFHRFNLFGKFHTHLGERARLALAVSGFGSAWRMSGQIPQRSVDAGALTRFGSVDPLEGGATGRQDLTLTYSSDGPNGSDLELNTFVSRYNFKLLSNFTFFLNDPVNGDMIEQTDDRMLLGLNGRYRNLHGLGNFTGRLVLAGGFRSDFADVGLWHSPNQVRLDARVDAQIREQNLFLWAQEEVIFGPKWRLQLGLRGDYFTFNVDDRLEGIPSDLPHASGYAQDLIVNPKANLVFSPIETLDLYANFGTGFHSNDARAVVIGERTRLLTSAYRSAGLGSDAIADTLLAQNYDPEQNNIGTLPRATGAELGTRLQIGPNLNVSAAAWLLDMENEYVFIGDEGTTELSGPTRRYGLDMELRWRILPWLFADANVNLSHGEFTEEAEGEDRIPLAPNLTSVGGLTVNHASGIQGRLGYRHVADRPANEDASITALGYTILDLSGNYTWRQMRFELALENLFDSEWNEAQFATESRLRNELEPVDELHFTPGNPFNVRVGIAYLF